MTLLLRFLRLDWPRALAFTAIVWLCFVAVELGNSRFVGWESTVKTWLVNAPLLFALFASLRVILFFGLYRMLWARALSFDEAYKRFLSGLRVS